MKRLLTAALLWAMCLVPTFAVETPSEGLLIVNGAPATGLVVADVDVGQLWPNAPGPLTVSSARLPDGSDLPVTFAPGHRDPSRGVLIARLPQGGDTRLVVTAVPFEAAPPSLLAESIRTDHVAITFAKDGSGGLPARIEFLKTGKVFEGFVWNDRVHDSELGSFHLRYDAGAGPVLVASGPLCSVVRATARYCRPDGTRPPSEPEATYDWIVFNDLPLVCVTARVSQKTAFDWEELHFLELNFPDESFLDWAGGEPVQQDTFTASKETVSTNSWGALVDGTNVIAMLDGGVKFYDGRGEYGTYMHSTWTSWSGTDYAMTTWLWLGNTEEAVATVQEAARSYEARPGVLFTRATLHEAIETLRAQATGLEGAERAGLLWRATLAERAERGGALDEAERCAEDYTAQGFTTALSGDMGLAFRATGEGITSEAVLDARRGYQWLAADAAPLFEASLRSSEERKSAHISGDTGWRHASIARQGGGVVLTWEEPQDERLAGLKVIATATPVEQQNAWDWELTIDNPTDDWSVWDVTFPQVALAEPPGKGSVLVPQGAGRVEPAAWAKPFSFRGRYPSGWCCMQFMAAYGDASGGFYLATHDPLGSTKEFLAESDTQGGSVRLEFEWPAPDMGVPGNDFSVSGAARWQLFDGDWFDASMVYKAWARDDARWWPDLGANGREDTPLWMRELPAWAQTGGAPGDCVEAVKEMARFLDVPIGFHWYNWHQIPFDNDYPHYFPVKEGFAEAVKELQEAGVYVMPYINGRLWDTHDKGVEDFEFSSVAMPAVSKNEKGRPYTEKYGSKEADGSPVTLGVMCPSTALWQQRVKDIVLRLQNEYGVAGVYIDQIAAAAPTLCMDKGHGHALGGGAWWNEGYWRMLEGIQAEMADGKMITTECNAEPFNRWLDAFLTWHWQYDGQVPAFPAVYGGTCQMFGRAYRGGDTKDLALRMKAGQQLVWGEQLGWLDPGLLKQVENAAFFRQAVQLRWRFRRYFYAGEMARPPKLAGPIPQVKADWQWSGEWWVTTDALMTGAWRIPAEGKTLLLFANVSDEPVTATFDLDAVEYGLSAETIVADVATGKEGIDETLTLANPIERLLTVPAHTAVAWELRAP